MSIELVLLKGFFFALPIIGGVASALSGGGILGALTGGLLSGGGPLLGAAGPALGAAEVGAAGAAASGIAGGAAGFGTLAGSFAPAAASTAAIATPAAIQGAAAGLAGANALTSIATPLAGNIPSLLTAAADPGLIPGATNAGGLGNTFGSVPLDRTGTVVQKVGKVDALKAAQKGPFGLGLDALGLPPDEGFLGSPLLGPQPSPAAAAAGRGGGPNLGSLLKSFGQLGGGGGADQQAQIEAQLQIAKLNAATSLSNNATRNLQRAQELRATAGGAERQRQEDAIARQVGTFRDALIRGVFRPR